MSSRNGASMKERILGKKKIVIKVGTSSITYDNGKLNSASSTSWPVRFPI